MNATIALHNVCTALVVVGPEKWPWSPCDHAEAYKIIIPSKLFRVWSGVGVTRRTQVHRGGIPAPRTLRGRACGPTGRAGRTQLISMWRWRRKQGVKFGRVRFGELLTMAQKRSKVRQGFWKLWSRFAPPFSGSGCRFAGPFFGPVFRVALNEFYMGEGEIRATRAPLFFLSRDPEIRATDPPEIAAPFLFLARARKQRGQGHGHMAMGATLCSPNTVLRNPVQSCF